LSFAGELTFPMSPCFVSSNVETSRKYCKISYINVEERINLCCFKGSAITAKAKEKLKGHSLTHILSIDGTFLFTISSTETCIRTCSKFASIYSAALTKDNQSSYN
jgi:hypothetical protein